MAKAAYIGINTQVPIYSDTTTEFSITSDSLLHQCFMISYLSNDDYEFVQSMWDGYFSWVNNNWGDEDDPDQDSNTSSGILFTARIKMPSFSFDWRVSSEEGYDKLIITKNNIEIINASGEQASTWTGSLEIGDKIYACYTKDSSSYGGSDEAVFGKFRGTMLTQTVVGSTMKSVARNISNIYIGIDNIARPVIKAYIGDATGKARPFWGYSLKDIQLYGTITPLPDGKEQHAAGQNENFALFGGGGWTVPKTDSVYGYDKYLITHTAPSLFYEADQLSAASTKDYVVFAGGQREYNGNDFDNNDTAAYSTELTRTYPTALQHGRTWPLATNIKNSYMIFYGGTTRNSNSIQYYSTIDIYDSNLTHTYLNGDYDYDEYGAAAWVGNYALFAPGIHSFSDQVVSAIDINLTIQSNIAPLSVDRYMLPGSHLNHYAIFSGGEVSSSTSSSGHTPVYNADAYDSNLTKIIAPNCTAHGGGSDNWGIASIDWAALFYSRGVLDIYDDDLTFMIGPVPDFSDWGPTPYVGAKGAVIDKYVLFGGGSGYPISYWHSTDAVLAYTF